MQEFLLGPPPQSVESGAVHQERIFCRDGQGRVSSEEPKTTFSNNSSNLRVCHPCLVVLQLCWRNAHLHRTDPNFMLCGRVALPHSCPSTIRATNAAKIMSKVRSFSVGLSTSKASNAAGLKYVSSV